MTTPETPDLVARLRRGDLCNELHPVETGNHATWDKAREIIGHHHDKASLVQVVGVLLDALERMAGKNARLAAKVDELDNDRVAYEEMVTRLAGGLDSIDAAADRWLAILEVRRMVQAITSVFARYASDDIMNRFQDKVTALMHQAFAEGTIVGIDSQRPKITAAEAERDRYKAALERITNVRVAFDAHPVGVIETLREFAAAALAPDGERVGGEAA